MGWRVPKQFDLRDRIVYVPFSDQPRASFMRFSFVCLFFNQYAAHFVVDLKGSLAQVIEQAFASVKPEDMAVDKAPARLTRSGRTEAASGKSASAGRSLIFTTHALVYHPLSRSLVTIHLMTPLLPAHFVRPIHELRQVRFFILSGNMR